MDPLTPSQYMEQHHFTSQLRRLGVTDEQRRAIQFRSNNRGFPFALWQVGWVGDLPSEASNLISPYCALKWLILDNPPWSRDKDDAWRLVSDALVAPMAMMGARQSEAQRARAQRPRGRVLEDGTTMHELIAQFCLRPEYLDLTVKDLWPHFHAELGKHGLDPKEIQHTDDFNKDVYEYDDFRGKRREITWGHFANVVSRCRNREKSG